MAIQCIHFVVSGRVQGVYYRASTQEQAQYLDLVGWVSNLDDGRVEGVACGEEVELQQFKAWLHDGPLHAKVSHVVFTDLPVQDFDDFEVRY